MASPVQFPLAFKKLVCTKLTSNFRDAVTTQTVQITEADLAPAGVLIKTRYVGINSSIVVATAGKYPNMDPTLPFDIGNEALGEVVWAGSECTLLKPGDIVALTFYPGLFSEYIVVSDETRPVKVPSVKPEYLAYIVSGSTASISYEKLGELKPKETVLVTAAAGGTGQFAVQLARSAGCHVIGTCSSENKVEFLKSIGCHRPVNYVKENLKEVLQKEYPKGIDVVYECVGGETFNTCVENLAVGGRLIIIGMIDLYKKERVLVNPTIPLQYILLKKSASTRGFFLGHFLKDIPRHILQLDKMESTGELKVKVDQGSSRPEGPFSGLSSIPDAVEYIHTKQSNGKVFVDLEHK